MKPARSPRRGIAMFMVVALGVVFIFLIGFMISHTGDMRAASNDQSQIVRARAIAEAAGALAMADVLAQGQNAFGGTGVFKPKNVASNGDTGVATTNVSGAPPSQRTVTSGPCVGLKCFYTPLTVSATGTSAGKGNVHISMSAGLQKIPILQYGMFKQGSFTLGQATYVGPLHSNGSITLSTQGGTISMTGPVTAAQSISRNGSGGVLAIQVDPAANPAPGTTWTTANNTIVSPSNQPSPVGGVVNVRPNIGQLKLPIAVDPYAIIQLMKAGDPEDLKKVNFDWLRSQQPSIDPSSRFVAVPGVPPAQSWITGPHVFFDPSAWRWCRVWDVDMAQLALSANKDSIFVLADEMPAWTVPGGGPPDIVPVNAGGGTYLDPALKVVGTSTFSAFRIINGATLDRNLTISSPNVVYMDNSFNTTPAIAGVPTSYRNTLVAADIVKFLGNTFNANRVATFQWYTCPSPATWQADAEAWMRSRVPPALRCTGPRTYGMISMNTVSANIRYNMSIINGEGWTDPVTGIIVGAGRVVLENWNGKQLQANGSKVYLWESQATNHRIQYFQAGEGLPLVSYYSPPVRVNIFDTKLQNLANMPPATPFLAQLARFDWKEGR